PCPLNLSSAFHHGLLERQEPCAAITDSPYTDALNALDYAHRLHDWLRPGGRLFALLAQVVRRSAANGVIEGPPYHGDINAMRALFDATRWQWPAPPYERGEGRS